MNEDEIIEYVIAPERHDRWSLFVLGVGFVGDICKSLADYTSTAALMAAQHRAHKKEKSRFYEIVR